MRSEAPDDRHARAADARPVQPPVRAPAADAAEAGDSGDSRRRAAFAELYERFYEMILSYAFRRTLNVAAAEEVTSNTFFKALRALPDYRAGDQPVQAWLYAIATNELRMHWRWRQRHPMRSLEELDAAQRQRVLFDAGGRSVLDQQEENERRMIEFARVHEALSTLPERYQTVLTLRYFERLSLEQIADVTGRPLGSVKSRLHRATAKLKDCLQLSTGDLELVEMHEARAAAIHAARASS